MAEAIAFSWRAEVDALTFQPTGHEGLCFVHRRALRTLVGNDLEGQAACVFAADHAAAFQAAALQKIGGAKVASGGHFHLTSRDLRRHIFPSNQQG